MKDIQFIRHSSEQVEIVFIFSEGFPSQASLWLSTEDSLSATVNQILEFAKRLVSRI